MKRNVGVLVCLCLVLCGCGKWNGEQGNVSAPNEQVIVHVDNPTVNGFNEQLASISNESSARQAIGVFVGYVDSRLKSEGVSVSSAGIISSDKLDMMVKSEMESRGLSRAISSVGGLPNIAYLCDIGVVTDGINELGKDLKVHVDDQMVQKTKLAVESTLTNINPTANDLMTPLEAMVIAYATVTGDDGTAKEGSISIPREKLSAFINKVVQ